ncbi:cell division protein FtsX [Fusibacter tunisiensis]|uniref:Cell division protein FtsX n=1 Tax=Fusibacter tunisiensis TaxID=1008308 RepID=A0ABS2MRH7_9FIRM|nr:permease-like cell division protein FtsX [Fusibacter tunisiensis]MBM7561985.1 cell division transport system permease protein [Fusibacter tunisiensis]
MGLKNTGYFLNEIRVILLKNKMSSLLSFFSIILIFGIVIVLVTSVWMLSNWVSKIQDEAEISIFYDQSLEPVEVDALFKALQEVSGIESVRSVTADEAHDRMSNLLDDQAHVLLLFDETPFEPFFEITFNFDHRETMLLALKDVHGISYIRDNREILDRLADLEKVAEGMSLGIGIAMLVAMFIITSHVIREGIVGNYEHIKTLKLLGAPDWFINTPYVIEGAILTGISALIAYGLSIPIMESIHRGVVETVVFLPLLEMNKLWIKWALYGLPTAFVLGLLSSYFSLKTPKTT